MSETVTTLIFSALAAAAAAALAFLIWVKWRRREAPVEDEWARSNQPLERDKGSRVQDKADMDVESSAALLQRTVADAADAVRAAAAAGVQEGLSAAWAQVDFRADLQRAAAEAARDHMAGRWDELRRELVGELRKAVEADARDASAAARASPPPEPAQVAPPSREPEPPPPPPVASAAPPPAGTGSGASGIRLDRVRPVDLLRQASQWLFAIGINDEEMNRLRDDIQGLEATEAVRKLFASLQKIAAERRLADDQPPLRWELVGESSLAHFVSTLIPGSDARIIWPRVGETYDPRTMHYLYREESGRGMVREIIAPGYTEENEGNPLRALVVY